MGNSQYLRLAKIVMRFPSQLPKAVIFDVDGTLYDQTKLRFLMLLEMGKFLLRSPQRSLDLKILWNFRKAREKHAGLETPNLEEQQYIWGARASGVSSEKVRQVVKEWMYEKPLPFLNRCGYKGVHELFFCLKEKGVVIGIFSDYPAHDKLNILGLHPDAIITATHPEVSRLKPDPAGLLQAAAELQTPIRECLFIGDREERDGRCARRAGMPYIIMASGQKERQFRQLRAWIGQCTG